MNKQLVSTLDIIRWHIRKVLCPISDIMYFETGYKKDNVLPDDSFPWERFEKHTRLSGYDKHYWLKFSVDTPSLEEGKEIYLSLGTSHETNWDAEIAQGLLYVNGEMVQGLDINHTDYKLEYGKHYDIYVYMYTSFTRDKEEYSFYADLVAVNKPVEKLYYDLSVPYHAALCFAEDDERYIKLITPLVRACNLLELQNPPSDSFMASVDKCLAFLESEFYGKICGREETAMVNCIGHTHIDVAWLWTYAQTREKVQRSFSTVLKYMEQYPEYKFMSSQPQLYEYLKEEAPALYEKVKQAIKDGRWEVEGAMWLEADCNLVSGESFVRQLLFGKRFIKEEFDKTSEILWLPDVFGYSAALPQILRKSGVDKFFTSKISWNDTNKMPYDTFLWKGIDGTEIFTYFLSAQALPEDGKPVNYADYVGRVEPKWSLGTWRRYQQKAYNNEVMITYGHGDGGGGPTRDMIEQQRRLEKGIPGIPKTRQSHAAEVMNKAKANFERSCEEIGTTPRWTGELYLEFHRGTYTSMAKNKKNNRRAEFLLGNIEKLLSFGLLNGEAYPQAEVNKAWKTVLLNQFHDVIPGSSIKAVYDDSDVMYQEVFDFGKTVIAERLRKAADTFKTEKGALVYNPNSFEFSGIFMIDGKKYYAKNVPALNFKNVSLQENSTSVIAENNVIENKLYRIVLDENANISSLYDKRNNRELAKGEAVLNQFMIYEDRSYNYDAWELADYHIQKGVAVNQVSSIEKFEDSVSAGYEITREFGNSRIVQKICLYDESERIDFDTYVDWHENHCILKAEFPMDVAMEKATYEIQFGNLERVTHKNTSWDAAKFEVCGHKWADVSDNGYGVSLLNDCKYGYSCDGEKLTLSLLKASAYPNPSADREEHTFTYSLLPHVGNYVTGNTVRQAYQLNNPLYAMVVEESEGENIPMSPVTISRDNIIIETLKKAEDRNSLIVRAYDAGNMRTMAELIFSIPVKAVYVCDMMENRIGTLELIDNKVKIPVSNFEVITLEVEI